MVKEKIFIFKNSKNKKLVGILNLPKKKKFPLIIFAHGFKGTKSERKFFELGEKLTQNGIATFRFDFSGCGDSEGNFKDITIRQEVEDLKSAYNFLKNLPGVDKRKIGILGYSLGALVAALFQIQNPVAKTLIFISPPFNQEKLVKIWYKKRELKKWKAQKYLDTPRGRISIQYLRECQNYNPLISKIKVPTLILHGKKDKDVPIKFAKETFRYLTCPKKMVIIENADHKFEDFRVLKKTIGEILKWTKKNLN